MRRLKDKEHGAVAVTVALLMVVVLGMAAIVIDLGMVYAERAQLQNGADAAALAIAQDCANDHCGTYASTATTLAGANANDGKANAQATINGAAHTVTVETSTLTADNKKAVQHWFAPIIGVPETAVRTSATAAWGGPAKVTVFPFTAPRCLFEETPAGQEVQISTDPACTGAGRLPGAFGWLDDDGKDGCSATVDIDLPIRGEPGKSGPKNCIIDGTTILLPIYDASSGNGSHVRYEIYGFAAFKVSGHCWPGDKPNGCKYTGIVGKFVRLVSLADVKQYNVHELGGPVLNASFIRLTK